MGVRDRFIPTLDGQTLRRVAEGYAYGNGQPISPDRENDILFVNAAEHASPPVPARQTSAPSVGEPSVSEVPRAAAGSDEVSAMSLSGVDISELLRGVAASHVPPSAVSFDPVFFHRTLSRWIGISTPGTRGNEEPPDTRPDWDYDFWKAELIEEANAPAEELDETTYTFRVEVHRGEGALPECYRYWLRLASSGMVSAAGWLTSPPDLLGDDKQAARRFCSPPIDPATVQTLFTSLDESSQ